MSKMLLRVRDLKGFVEDADAHILHNVERMTTKVQTLEKYVDYTDVYRTRDAIFNVGAPVPAPMTGENYTSISQTLNLKNLKVCPT